MPAAVASLALLLSQPSAARAESNLSYKYEDYSEAGNRISVTTQSALVQQDFGPDTHVKILGVIDAIAGATPTGQPAPAGSDQVVLTDMHERRKAWSAGFTHQFTRIALDLGIANSRVSDYISDGWSLNAQAGFNEKNTTLSAGLAGTNDKVKAFFQTPWARKRNLDGIIGLTQLLDPQTSVTVNFSLGRATGYLSDQYKLVQKNVEVAPGVFLPFTFGENRPDERTRWNLFASYNHAIPSAKGALEASYRFYHDSFGSDTHTIEVSWFQQAGSKLVLQPSLRFYDQSAADFYYYDLNRTAITPTGGKPNASGPFYSSDYRLSALRAVTYGIKAVWTVSAHCQLDAGIDRYVMHGKDDLTPGSAYPKATVVNAGIKISW